MNIGILNVIMNVLSLTNIHPKTFPTCQGLGCVAHWPEWEGS